MSASAPSRAVAETVESVHETSERVARALVFGVPPGALGVGGWPASGGSRHATTIFVVSLAIVAAALIVVAIIDERNARGYGARQAWLSATVLTVGSVVSRGLAKSGRRASYTEDGSAGGPRRCSQHGRTPQHGPGRVGRRVRK